MIYNNRHDSKILRGNTISYLLFDFVQVFVRVFTFSCVMLQFVPTQDETCVISWKIFHDLKSLFQEFLRLTRSALGIYQELLGSNAGVKFWSAGFQQSTLFLRIKHFRHDS